MTSEVKIVAIAHVQTLSRMGRKSRPNGSAKMPAAILIQRVQLNGAYGIGMGVAFESCCARCSGSNPLQ
jgi:hypothetical protein